MERRTLGKLARGKLVRRRDLLADGGVVLRDLEFVQRLLDLRVRREPLFED